MTMTTQKLFQIIKERKEKMPKGSYVTSLFEAGLDRIVQKVGEEATEVVIAAKNKDKKQVISEVADLRFHLLVMIAALDIEPSEIDQELERRMKD